MDMAPTCVCETRLQPLVLNSIGMDGYGNRKLKRDGVLIAHYVITKGIVIGMVTAGMWKGSL